MLDWIIVGGGIHGVHLAAQLMGAAKVPHTHLRIVDPGPELLHTWRRCTGNTGMRFLRSPVVHHLDADPWSLRRFASKPGRRGRKATRGLFAAPYDRPATSLFSDHCQQVIERHNLSEIHVRDRAVAVELSCDSARAQLKDGPALEARQVLLALGTSEQPRWPAWAHELRAQGAQIHHVFEPGFCFEDISWPRRVAVVGAGISAAQVAMRLARAKHEVHLVARHPLRKFQFDSDPGWVGPKNMKRFSATRDPDGRRRMITQARHTGSLSPDIYITLRGAFDRGDITWHQGPSQALKRASDLLMRVGREHVAVDAILLATGFESKRPGGSMIDQLIDHHQLPCATCGYPVVDKHLRWHPRLFVTGPLAELELGPVSRNIVGARRAAERIVPWTHANRTSGRKAAQAALA